MAASRQNSAAELFFTPDVKAQIHAAIDSMLDVHDAKIRKAVETAEDKKLPVGFKLLIDCSESSPALSVDMRFTPETVTDSRSIQVTDSNQHEFRILTPAMMEEDAVKAKAAKAKAEAEAGASGTPDGETPEGEDKPRGKKRSK